MSAGGTARPPATIARGPEGCPPWLRPLVDNIATIPDAYRRRL
ncbi:MAG: CoA pyrophosphatase, partial [Mycobacterium sp.]